MARITIEFDTLDESLTDVVERLVLDVEPALPPLAPVDKPQLKVVATEQTAESGAGGPPGPPDGDDSISDDEKQFRSEPDKEPPTVELDKGGVPWDDRIHSENKKKTTAGFWQKRRSLPDGLYDKVTAELKAAATIPDPPPEETKDSGPAPPPGAWNWNTLVKALTKAIGDKNHSATKVQQDAVCKEMGITLFPLLSPRTELYDEFANKMGLVPS